VRVGRLELDPMRRRVTVDSEPVELSPREFRVLEYLVRNQSRVCTRDELLQEVWGYDPAHSGSNVIDVTMRRLRAKLGMADVIETVRNVGYCVG
jgi:DNA-binding response OmpR family regulator